MVGTASAGQSVFVRNTGASPLTVDAVTTAGDFAQTNNCQTLAAGANCTIQVTFSPTATGLRNGTITVSDDAGSQTVVLSGTGSSRDVSLNPSNLTFGSQTVRTTGAAESVFVTNLGTELLTIHSAVAAGDFALTNSCSTVAPGASCAMQVTFSPTDVGTRNGTITLSDSAGTHVVTLSGIGVAPGIGLSPATLVFGKQDLGSTSAAQKITLTYSGTSPLTIDSITVAGDFAQTNNCSTVSAGQSCTINVTFTPTMPGTRNGTITLADSLGVQTVSLIGASDFAIVSTNGSSPNAVVTAGGSATYQAVVSSFDYSGSVTFTCTGAPQGSRCDVQPSSVEMTGANSANVTVTVTTTGAATQASAGTMRNVPGMPTWTWLPLAAGLLMLPLRRTFRWRLGMQATCLAGMLVLLLVLTACGRRLQSSSSGSGSDPTPSGIYNLALVGTNGSGVQHSQQLTLRVD